MRFKINRVAFAIITGVLLSSCGGGSKDDSKECVASTPNIIYILTDDLGIGDIASFNENGKIETPHIDQLGAEGIKFRDAHSSSAVCTPTRYSIITGRYNWRSSLKKGVLSGYSEALIPESRETVASLLKSKGYHTSYIGKWHLGWNWGKGAEGEVDFSLPITHNPNDLGFDYAYGHCGSLDMAPYVYVENGKATAVPTKETSSSGGNSWWRKGMTSDDFIHDDVTPNFFRKGIATIKSRAKTGEPFFLYLPLPSPHTPVLPTEEWKGKSGLNPYADFVMMVDDYVGQLTAAVKEAGIEENTLIIFTSDNGCSPQANYKELIAKGHNPSSIYRGHKADIYEGGHRVPFIIKWPARIKGGGVSNKIICTTDFMATCDEIVGTNMSSSSGEDSFSLVPLFSDPNSDDFKRESIVHHSINGSFAIRRGDWKLALCPGSGGWSAPKPGKAPEGSPAYQLFNLATDPGEQINLIESEPERAAKLKAELLQIIDNGRSSEGPKIENSPSKNGEWKQLDAIKEVK